MATRSSRQSPRSMRSLSRPGVATTTSAPPRSALAWRPIDMPPTTVASRSLRDRAYGVSASVTCWASSRVGTRTRASGRRASARLPAVRASRARPKASVLPEPVRPRPRTSRPASEFGRVAAWIGNGTDMPSEAERRQKGRGHVQVREGLGGGEGGGDRHRQGELTRDGGGAAAVATTGALGSAGAAPRTRGALPAGCRPAESVGGTTACGSAGACPGKSVVRASCAFAVQEEPFPRMARIEGFFPGGCSHVRRQESQERADEISKNEDRPPDEPVGFGTPYDCR